MRMVRTAVRLLAGIALLPALATAQAADDADRNFRDSWFWGINGGAMMFMAGADEEVRVTAPMIGGEWLITRTRIALRLSIQHAFFDEQAGVFDPSVAGSVRPVDVSDWRRYGADIYFFPKAYGRLRPYGGLGLALNVIQNATPTGSFSSEEDLDAIFTRVDETATRAAAVFTAGMQAAFDRSALFLQASAMPTRNNFLLSRANYTFVLEAGIRYNFGSAIEKF